MSLTATVEKALGRMGYALRCLVNGWAAFNEEPALMMRVLMHEGANMAVQLHRGSVPDARAWFDQVAEQGWNDLLERNPHLAASIGEVPSGGGN